MDMTFTDEIISLGKSLSPSLHYKAEELFQGIKNEQVRLGKNPFIVVVSIKLGIKPCTLPLAFFIKK